MSTPPPPPPSHHAATAVSAAPLEAYGACPVVPKGPCYAPSARSAGHAFLGPFVQRKNGDGLTDCTTVVLNVQRTVKWYHHGGP